MIKSELVAALVLDGLEPKTARVSLDCLVETIASHLGKGGRVELRNFGSFTVRFLAPRPRQNPATGATNGMVSTRRVYFRPSKTLASEIALTRRVNGVDL